MGASRMQAGFFTDVARAWSLAAALAASAVLWTAPTMAQAPPNVVSLDGDLLPYLLRFELPAVAAAVVKNGKIVATVGAGGMQATGPARIASLSKAITAVCVSRLIDEGRLSFKAPLGNLLAKQFQALGQPVDPRFKTVQWNSC